MTAVAVVFAVMFAAGIVTSFANDRPAGAVGCGLLLAGTVYVNWL